MANRPAILSAKLDKLAEIMQDGNYKKRNPGSSSLDTVRQAQEDAALEVFNGEFGSVADVEAVLLPSERI